MITNKPRNVRDEDLIDGLEVIERGPDEPTGATYLLQRIRLSETCREILDQYPLAVMDGDDVAYEHVMEMDAKLEEFKKGIPPVFRMDHDSQGHLLSVDDRLMAGLTVQRYSLNLILYRQRCKLHLPYLARSSVEPVFAHARKVCVDSAKAIVQMEKSLRTKHGVLLSSRLRIIGVLRSIFMATIALVLDACVASSAGEVWDSEETLADAWTVLQEAHGQSPSAGRLLELSMQVLRTHNVAHPALEAIKRRTCATKTAAPRHPGPLPMTPESAGRNEQGMPSMPQVAEPEMEADFLEKQWQAIEGRMDLDAIDWEKLFWGLDAPFI